MLKLTKSWGRIVQQKEMTKFYTCVFSYLKAWPNKITRWNCNPRRGKRKNKKKCCCVNELNAKLFKRHEPRWLLLWRPLLQTYMVPRKRPFHGVICGETNLNRPKIGIFHVTKKHATAAYQICQMSRPTTAIVSPIHLQHICLYTKCHRFFLCRFWSTIILSRKSSKFCRYKMWDLIRRR